MYFRIVECLLITYGSYVLLTELARLFLIIRWEKRRFLTCPWHKIYRVKAVGLSFSKDTYIIQITIFVNMWNLGEFRKKLIFCQ